MTDTPTATPSQLNLSSRIAAGLLGHLAGDALGVPVQFKPRSDCCADPVDGMRGYGTDNQPPGTWSDDGSLTLCTAEALLDGFDLQSVANDRSRPCQLPAAAVCLGIAAFSEGLWRIYCEPA